MKVSTFVAMFWDTRMLGLLLYEYFLGEKGSKKSTHSVRFSKNSIKLDQNDIFAQIRWKSLKMANFMKNSIFSGQFLQYQDLWISNIRVHKYSF